MRLVVIESPYAGDGEKNLRYLRACMADCLRRGEAPFASHALYTQPGVLDDGVPAERRLGIDAGFAWAEKADAVVFYTDLGWSVEMHHADDRWGGSRMVVEYRSLPDWQTGPRLHVNYTDGWGGGYVWNVYDDGQRVRASWPGQTMSSVESAILDARANGVTCPVHGG